MNDTPVNEVGLHSVMKEFDISACVLAKKESLTIDKNEKRPKYLHNKGSTCQIVSLVSFLKL
jgi:hypothetical protein